MTKVGSSTQMVVFDIGDGLWFPSGPIERGDPRGVPLLSFCCASRWHKDVPRSLSPLLLERDEATRWRFSSMVSHVSSGKG